MVNATSNTRTGGSPILQFQGIGKSYGAVVALSDVDISVAKGEFLTLLGPSGSGKTTLLNIIAGTTEPTVGKVMLAGQDITYLPANKRRLGMVFQNYALFPHMTVFDNIAFPLKIRKLSQAEIETRVRDALSKVRLPDVSNRYPKQLSGGQQQRIAIARCIVYDPELILMDEPLGALDKKLREQLQFEIKRIHEELGVTILYVTHDQEEALVLSDRICLMNNGRVEHLGTPQDLYFRPKTVFTADFLGESNILRARVERRDGKTKVVAKGGLEFDLPQVPDSLSELDIMIRPESLNVGPEGSAGPCKGTIEGVTFSGGVTRLSVMLDDGTPVTAVRLTSDLGQPLEAGRRVTLSCPNEAVAPLI
jgi:putative spermidine/putrescine transport system ATP-binding protein